jgi:hypothetical protein
VNGGNPPPPGGNQCAFDHARGLVGVDETVRAGQNARMLGRHPDSPAEQQNVAGHRLRQQHRIAAMVSRSRHQTLASGPLGPVRRIGAGVFRHASGDLGPDSAHEAEAIAADTLARSLVPVGRADPAAGGGDDALAVRIRTHGTIGLPS